MTQRFVFGATALYGKRQRDSAARLRELKKAKLSSSSTADSDNPRATDDNPSTHSDNPPSTSSTLDTSPVDPEDGSGSVFSESENERDTSGESENETDFDDEKAQKAFDDWVFSLPLVDRKMLAVLIMETIQKRTPLKSTAAALEAAWITGFNEKTATRWLHCLGFRPTSHKKGAYVDGHERDDVVAHRKKFLDQMKGLREALLPPPPPSDERAATPPPDAEHRKRLVLIYHDESIFNTNEGQKWAWTTGAGIMVSDFIEQHDRCLRLDEEEAGIPKTARVLLEYGAEKEGYWNSERFMKNMEDAVKIAEFKYPPHRNTIVFIFDQSSCHKAYAEDALNASCMNMRPGGKQPCMRNTIWSGRVQKMVNDEGILKGMKAILEERGINTSRMKADDMRTVLSFHDDFVNEKTIVEHFITDKSHTCLFLPKFHCELNPIERVWGQAKVYSRAHTNFTLVGLRAIINPSALNSVSTDLMRKFFRRVLEYERAYLEGKKAGKELEAAVKVCKSHRRIFFESN